MGGGGGGEEYLTGVPGRLFQRGVVERVALGVKRGLGGGHGGGVVVVLAHARDAPRAERAEHQREHADAQRPSGCR